MRPCSCYVRMANAVKFQDNLHECVHLHGYLKVVPALEPAFSLTGTVAKS